MKVYILLFFFIVVALRCEKDFSPIEFDDRPAQNDPGTVIEKKPNIYIYPVQQMSLEVSIFFPNGGDILESIPVYQNGWFISVEKSGLIDEQYNYLYYESRTPDLFQYEKGWIVSRENLSHFFKTNMNDYGFDTHEINDFTEYWIPRLNSSEMYAIYPQSKNIIEKMIRLEFSQNPDSMLRLFYVIKEFDGQFNLTAPTIMKFEREDFTVVEWGVIQK